MSQDVQAITDERISDINIVEEMENSFLEYAYSVIHARALPDARDGLKPVQRRILFQMDRMGLRPDKAHVKSSRVVGEVMGKLHPHGDSAIYDAMVRMSQNFSLRVPLIDGHGNFGSLDDGPAAPRYTEARLASAALALTADLDEDTVDFVPNYDNQYLQPEVLPASFPNLLVNGASGIAVGMATNIPTHNLGETINAALALMEKPDLDLAELMQHCPGPDLPGGGVIVGLDPIREAYASGRGTFKVRARLKVERISARKQGIVITELPYMIGPERVAEKLKEGVNNGKIKGVSGWQDLTDRTNGMHLVIEIKNGFNPEAIIDSLYRYTPLEDSFGINNVALVDGQPQTLGLKQMLEVFVSHRRKVTRRRCEFRLKKCLERLHLVEGLLIAVLDIDRVIATIRQAADTAQAKDQLCKLFSLSPIQAEYVLELRLRRLTKFSRIELENENNELKTKIAELNEILASEAALDAVIKGELLQTAQELSTARRTVLIDEQGLAVSGSIGNANVATTLTTKGAAPLEIADDPCLALMSPTGEIARIAGGEDLLRNGPRLPNDALRCTLKTTVRSEIGVVTNRGFLLRLNVVDLPALPRMANTQSWSGAISISSFVALEEDEIPVALLPLDPQSVPAGFITRLGRIKRLRPEYPNKGERFEIMALEDHDEIVAAGLCPDNSHLVLISDDAQLLRTPADKVRPQGRSASGMIGMALRTEYQVIAGAIIPDAEISSSVVVTVAALAGTLAGTNQSSVKVTPLDRFPVKGRGSQGVRAQRLLRTENQLALAWCGMEPPKAMDSKLHPVDLPEIDERRDGSGSTLHTQISYIA